MSSGKKKKETKRGSRERESNIKLVECQSNKMATVRGRGDGDGYIKCLVDIVAMGATYTVSSVSLVALNLMNLPVFRQVDGAPAITEQGAAITGQRGDYGKILCKVIGPRERRTRWGYFLFLKIAEQSPDLDALISYKEFTQLLSNISRQLQDSLELSGKLLSHEG